MLATIFWSIQCTNQCLCFLFIDFYFKCLKHLFHFVDGSLHISFTLSYYYYIVSEIKIISPPICCSLVLSVIISAVGYLYKECAVLSELVIQIIFLVLYEIILFIIFHKTKTHLLTQCLFQI